jgi:hypothetical protein
VTVDLVGTMTIPKTVKVLDGGVKAQTPPSSPRKDANDAQGSGKDKASPTRGKPKTSPDVIAARSVNEARYALRELFQTFITTITSSDPNTSHDPCYTPRVVMLCVCFLCCVACSQYELRATRRVRCAQAEP